MNKETSVPIVKSIIKRVFKINHAYNTAGSTNKSRYCYSVWLRHLNHWNSVNQGVPEVVAELGPGNSLGIGFAALLSGSKQLHALDVVKYWHEERNLKMFNNLVELFKNRTKIPDQVEFAKVKPLLDDYSFPSRTLTNEVLEQTLNEDRLNTIRKEILDIDNPNNTFIKYHIPWSKPEVINNGTVDFVYSQSVLQYIEDLETTYGAIKKWLKPSGLMSHTIDLSSIGITKNWNSHWTFNDLEWKFIKNGKAFTITRKPFSKHIKQHLKLGFKILKNRPVKRVNKLKKHLLADKYKHLSDEDLITSEAYILSRKV